ncbi:MAG: Stk1 family PASTA domain-containing Ser/Thr kinase [Clostridium sp.]
MIGRILGNRYELLEKIGEGGMAIVYKAKCTILNRFVAVKILKPEYSNNADFMDKFQREALATASFSHNNIVSIYDVGSEDNINYIVMELVTGKTLKEYIRENAPLDVETTLKISIQIAKALECAHKNKIIHRDIKPHNILVTEEEIIKVTDFGIAKAASAETITHTNKVIGSAHYFSPEQAKGKIVDNRTDIYSFGIVIYEMVTGRVPFDGETAVAVALKHIQDEMIPPINIVPSLPRSINNLILKATQKEMSKRYNNVTDMLIDLIRIEKNKGYIVTPANVENEYTTVMDVTQIQNTVHVDKKDIKSALDEEDEEEFDEEDDDDNDGTSVWKKILLIGGAVVLFIVLGVFAGNLIYNNAGGGTTSKKENPKVPAIMGIKEADAKAKVEEEGLTFVVLGKEKSDEPVGTIIAVFPNEGTEVKKKSEVRVRISNGPEEKGVPEVLGLGKSVAQNQIVNAGFKVGTITEEYDDEVPVDAVISIDPAPGTMAKKGSTVNIVISKGSKVNYSKAPDLTNKTLSEAESILAVSNLKLGNQSPVQTEDKSKDGKIFNQSIDKGTKVQEGTAIDVNYYQYVDPDAGKVEVKNVTGKTVAEAISELKALGFTNITAKYQSATGTVVDSDIVIYQSPLSGKINPEDSITLTVKDPTPTVKPGEDEEKPSNP